MQTRKEYMDRMFKEIRDSLTHFLLNHSEIECRKPYDEIWCMGPEGDRYYEDMDSIGRKMQAYLMEEYALFQKVLEEDYIMHMPEEVVIKVDKANLVLSRTIEHKLTFCESNKQALTAALEAFDVIVEAMNNVPEQFLS